MPASIGLTVKKVLNLKAEPFEVQCSKHSIIYSKLELD